MKKLIRLTANNNKGFNFIKKYGSYHNASVKNKGLVVTTNTKKIVIKHNKDKRFNVEYPNSLSINQIHM